nr:DUF3304 domain-containing protein [Yersinia pekkanenii]
MKIVSRPLLAGAFLLALSSQLALAGTIEAVNHTKWAINHFSVNGQSAIDAIGPFQGGGGGGSYSAPSQWNPSMTVQVVWETGLGTEADSPFPVPTPPNLDNLPRDVARAKNRQYFNDRQEWFLKIKNLNKQHSRIVPLPAYTSGGKTCGITIHFMPCDQIKVTTSCYEYGHPNYPIKEPIHMKEPAVCTR